MSRSALSQWLLGAALIAALCLAPAVLGEYPQQILFRLVVALILAEAWNLLVGMAGLVTLGTSSAVGLGGYVTVALLNHAHWPLLPALLAAAAGGALLATMAAPGLLRLRGLYFTVGTLALAEVLRLLMINSERFGGATGLFLDRDSPSLPTLIRIASAVLAVSWLVWGWCNHGRASVLLRAVRDDEEVAAQFGVRCFRVKVAVFATAMALMAIAGGVQALKLGAIEPYGMFGLRWSIDALSMTIIGGVGSRLGPAIGAVILILSSELLAEYPEAHLALTGALLILMMRFAPRGVAGLLAALWSRRRATTQVSAA